MKKSKQLSLIQKTQSKKEHSGSLAVGPRSLFRHKKLILGLMKKNAFRFQIKVYEYAIQGNHLHLFVKAQSREGMQNFFRVLAGHTAQRILKDNPLNQEARGGASKREVQKVGCEKNQRVFWSYLVYSRVVSWGREFRTVTTYNQKNTLELLQIIAYQPRSKSSNKNSS